MSVFRVSLGGVAAGLFLLRADAVWAFTPERVAEPPPAIYAAGPTLTGRTTELRLDRVEAVDALCRAMLHGLPRGVRRGAYYMACYAPQLDAVIIMRPQAWPSRREWEALRAHEWAHARGWRHAADGGGTDWAASLPPPGGGAGRLATAAPADASSIK